MASCLCRLHLGAPDNLLQHSYWASETVFKDSHIGIEGRLQPSIKAGGVQRNLAA